MRVGTAYVVENERDDNTIIDPHLKYDRSGSRPIILVPQPSDDPEDPLVRLLVQMLVAY